MSLCSVCSKPSCAALIPVISSCGGPADVVSVSLGKCLASTLLSSMSLCSVSCAALTPEVSLCGGPVEVVGFSLSLDAVSLGNCLASTLLASMSPLTVSSKPPGYLTPLISPCGGHAEVLKLSLSSDGCGLPTFTAPDDESVGSLSVATGASVFACFPTSDIAAAAAVFGLFPSATNRANSVWTLLVTAAFECSPTSCGCAIAGPDASCAGV
mmetsp:Transcript_18300/g.32726  ORF Transcript_18300/g.32726 Transcript_18300/m.32726 type:complete len:212 (-) Transcript_18300:603-1238(-)